MLFIIINVVEYLLLLNAFPFSTKAHIAYFMLFYIELKFLYKDEAQITDVFTLGIASLLMIIINLILYPIAYFFNNYFIFVMLTRIGLFAALFLLKNKLYIIQNLYYKLWNRNDKIKKLMKSTTFRSMNVVIFNLMFYIINICMLYCILDRRC